MISKHGIRTYLNISLTRALSPEEMSQMTLKYFVCNVLVAATARASNFFRGLISRSSMIY
jgi:hypothetical protein